MGMIERVAHVLVIVASALIVTGVLTAAFRAWFATVTLFAVGFVCIVASCCLMSVACLSGGDYDGPGEGHGEDDEGERG